MGATLWPQLLHNAVRRTTLARAPGDRLYGQNDVSLNRSTDNDNGTPEASRRDGRPGDATFNSPSGDPTQWVVNTTVC